MLGWSKTPPKHQRATEKQSPTAPRTTRSNTPPIEVRDVQVSLLTMPFSPQLSAGEYASYNGDAASRIFSPTGSVANTLTITKHSSKREGRSGVARRPNINMVQEQYSLSRSRAYRELGANVGAYAFDTSFTGLMEWIRSERLTRLPHKGGSWDRVLIAAQHFADQVNRFNYAVESFATESGAASQLVFGQMLLLLELGHENASALEDVFGLFYQFGLELSPLLRRSDIFASSQTISENVGKAFSQLVGLVTNVAVTFYSAVHGERGSTTIDIFSTFSSSIENFRECVSQSSLEMWSHSLLSHGVDDVYDLEVLQSWLSPQDSVLAFLASNNINLSAPAEQFTCTWFQSPLTSFLRSSDSVLTVEGKSGAGKTTLANWVVDRLQRPIGRKLVSTLSFFFNSSITAQATTVSLLKTLLWQLISQRIGDVQLFDTLNEAYQQLEDVTSSEKQEQLMWETFERALKVISGDETEVLAIVVDGLDEIVGQKPVAQAVSKRLQELAQKIGPVRLIQFTQQLDSTPSSSFKIHLSTEYTLDDINTVFRHGLLEHPQFKDRDESYKERIYDELSLAADSSILWTYLAVQYLLNQHTHPTLDQALEALKTAPKTIPDIVEKVLAGLSLVPESKILLSWLIASERPLTLPEVESLLHAQPGRPHTSERVDIPALLKSVAPFSIIGEGLIALRHPALKDALLSIPSTSKVTLPLKEAHKDLLTRILTCVKPGFPDDREPTYEFLDVVKVRQPLSSYKLREYTIRYWTTHFKKSSLFSPSGDLSLPKEFATVFPGTVSFPLLEEICWRFQMSPQDSLDFYSIAYRVRKALFGEEHPAVLQTTIVLAVISQRFLSQPTQAIDWYYKVIQIASKLYGPQSDLVVVSVETFLTISETSITKTRTDIMTYREQVFQILITAYKHRYGSNSKEVTEVYQKLASLYVSIGETDKATETNETVRKITTVVAVRPGVKSRDISFVENDSHTRSADITLAKHDHKKIVDTYQSSLFSGYAEEVGGSFTSERVEVTLRRALELIKREEHEKAEELYIELWWKLTEHCQTVHALEWHQKKLELMLTYSRFLHSHKRNDEAASVLLSAWREYEHHEFSMFESIVVLLKEVAITMKSVGLSSVALTIFQRCWSWYKNSHKESTTEFKQIEERISSSSRELVQQSSSTAVTASSEVIIREVFMQSMSNSEELSTNNVELSRSLTSIYMEQSRYSEATEILEKTLKKSWSSFFAESIDSITMTSKFTSESIDMVMKLAQCYIDQKRFEKAENIYLRLYRVHRKTKSIDDAAVVKYREIYLDFLKKHHLTNQVITFYQELLVDSRTFHGASHTQTIKVLYILGDTCRKHYLTHGYWIEYYLEIINSLNKTDIICHEEALRALIIVAEHYYETQRYSESLTYFKSIVATFIKFGTKYKYFESSTELQKILEKYYQSIEETKIDVNEHVKILKEIREASIKHFGDSSSITIYTTSSLAETCVKSEQHQYEATSYYEHILQHSKSVSSEVVKRTQSTLRTLYIRQITSSNSSRSVSKESMETASTMLSEKYVEIRKIHSITSETTLSHLKDLVTLYHKQNKQESSIKELKSAIVEIVTKVHSAKEQVYAADFLSSVFTSCGYRSQALELIHELKIQIIYKSAAGSSKHGFNVTQVGRSSFAFLATFEYNIRADYSLTVSHLMSEIVAEYVFYERFVQCIKTRSKLQQVFIHASRIRRILARNQRLKDFGFVEAQLVEYFSSTETQVTKKTSQTSIRMFVSVVLQYVSERANVHFKSFVTAASHAAISQLRILLTQKKHKDALEVATCTYHFLMAHEGLDDPTEITLGFQLTLLMAGRGEGNSKSSDPAIQKAMLDLSRTVLAEVFNICKGDKIDIARVQLTELNELVSLVGEHNDWPRLQWLLHELWTSREGQVSWPQETILELGKRLVEAEFTAGKTTTAIRLCEDIVYNVRRANGARHPRTLSFYTLLASLYTSVGKQYTSAQGDANQKKRNDDLARIYFKKAINVHEDVLKLLVDDGLDNSDEDDDLESEVGIQDSVSYAGGRGSFSPRRKTNGVNGVNGAANGSTAALSFTDRNEELEYVRQHLRLLKLAVQRYGAWTKSSGEFTRLTDKVSSTYGGELKLNANDVSASKWKIDGFGHGKAEAEGGAFVAPTTWYIVA